jgi:hypothetical protein
VSLFTLDGRRDMSLKKPPRTCESGSSHLCLVGRTWLQFSIDTLPPLTLVDVVVLSHALRAEAICAVNPSPLQAACCAVGLSPPIRTSGSKNANAGDQEFRCLSACARLVIPPGMRTADACRRPGVLVAIALRRSRSRPRTTKQSKNENTSR